MKKTLILGFVLLLLIYVGLRQSENAAAQEGSVLPDGSAPVNTSVQMLPFTQNWTNTGLITANDDWSGVLGMEGYLGQDITLTTGTDPQTLLTTSVVANDLDDIANQAAPDTLTSGGVAEFDGIANPVVALQGSGTADAPYLLIYLNTTGKTNVNVAYNLRDIDASTDNAVQPAALQYRVGSTGNFTNVPAGFVADATTGPSLATLVTPVSAVLGADANNQALVQVRIITTNAVGNDEWVGVDDINITATSSPTATTKFFSTRMKGSSEVPANNSTGSGYGTVLLNDAETQITASFFWEGLGSATTAGHIHTGAVGVSGPITFDMAPPTGATSGRKVNMTFAITPAQVADLRAGNMYFNIHTSNFGGGEIRGQLVSNLPDAPSDFNGDGKTDYALVRLDGVSAGRFGWFIKYNGPDTTLVKDFGLNGDFITPGDFDGDGKDDIAIWRQGGPIGNNDTSGFYVFRSSDSTFDYFRFGQAGDDATIVADYTGDGKDDPAIYRPGVQPAAGNPQNQSQFWFLASSGPAAGRQVAVNWGLGPDSSGNKSDLAYPGDFDGDGKADFCVIRPVGTQATFITAIGNGSGGATLGSYTPFGKSTSASVTDDFYPGDYDGDGKTDFATARVVGSRTDWYYLPSSGGQAVFRSWGLSSDIACQGDYDGDGKTDLAVWRPNATTGSFFYVIASTNGLMSTQWGIPNDVPVAADSH